VRVNDCSFGQNSGAAIVHDLRKTGEYYMVPPARFQVKVRIYIEISTVNKGGNDQYDVVTIYGYDEKENEKVRDILAHRFSAPDKVEISPEPRIKRERREAHQREREMNFLAYMRQFEGVDFT
jgi:hypothetical protein